MENRVEYWSTRWQKEDTPWHLKHVNRFLDKHFHHISNLKEGPCKIFVPLCGKTFDLKWYVKILLLEFYSILHP